MIRAPSRSGASYSETFLHADHLGSPAAATDYAGAILWRESYDPFGGKRLDPAANKDATGFTGHVQDDATGLAYMQARYYDPVIGRFLSTDPIGYQDQLNLYAYVHNDPVNKTDPTGEFGLPGAAIGAIAGTAFNVGATADKVTWQGVVGNAFEGALVGGTIGSGAGLLSVAAVGGVGNVVEQGLTNSAVGESGGPTDGVLAAKSFSEGASIVLGDAAKGAVNATVGKVVGGPAGEKVATALKAAGSALASVGSKAVGPALSGAAPFAAETVGSAVGAAVESGIQHDPNAGQHLRVPQLDLPERPR